LINASSGATAKSGVPIYTIRNSFISLFFYCSVTFVVLWEVWTVLASISATISSFCQILFGKYSISIRTHGIIDIWF
jgi:hypothetical protein